MIKKLLAPGLILLAFAGCKEKDPVNPPVVEQTNVKACFTPSKTFIDSGETVTFVNCSENENSWEWRFEPGNEITNEKEAAPHTYAFKPGKYPVTLTVFSKDGKYDDDTTINIVVARKSYSKIVVKKYPALTSGGSVWDADDNSSADVKMYYGPVSDPLKYETQTVTNATGEITFLITPAIEITDANNGGWVFKLVDDDGGNNQPMATFGTGGDIYLSRTNISPVTIVDNANYQIEAYFDRVQP
jgi:PKD repeat protein